MTDTNHERWSDDLAAYMLGALDPKETAELERHALGCERCRDQLRWLAPAVQALPDSVERLEPPRELRSRILAEVRSDETEAARHRGLVSRRPALGLAALALIVAAVAGYAIGRRLGG
jgi:anti-sigma factor RsiW